MATDLENLRTRRAAVCVQIAALGTTNAGGKPNATGDGVNVDHQGYKKSLYDELAMLDGLIAAAEGRDVGWVESQEYCG